ncbi:hypothetical protein QYF36_014609 [Acer negundo]|nr:hypothetical protein QYF36_014609 [Acer negundo]
MKMMRCLSVCVIFLFFTLKASADFNYMEALDKSLLFLEAQRAGKLPTTQRVKWRGDSALKDGFLQGVDLVGGYYDAGDHVKFGLPMAYTTTMLAWGVVDYRKEITDLDQMGHTLLAIRWATDYFIKAHPQPDVLWGQVGDGDSDHYCWERAEDMTTPRDAYKIDKDHPGSDLAAETAAALAAASIAFRPYNSSYSNLLLLHAKQLFSFADRFRGLYDESIKCALQFYTSSGYSDELLWGATWLYRATEEEYYLKYVVDNAEYMGGIGWAVKEFSWDNKYAGVQILLSKILMEGKGGEYTSTLKQYQAKANYFACACLQKNNGYNVHLTPGGLMYVREWNNLQYSSSAAFLLAVYSDYLSAGKAQLTCPDGQIQTLELLNFAKSQNINLTPNSKSLLIFTGPYPKESSIPYQTTLMSYEQETPAVPETKPKVVPVEFTHSITSTWTIGETTYYRHKVIIKNTSEKPVIDLKLAVENLSGPIWGLSPTQEKNTYQLPPSLKTLKPASECIFVYVQGGPQAKVSLLSYHY